MISKKAMKKRRSAYALLAAVMIGTLIFPGTALAAGGASSGEQKMTADYEKDDAVKTGGGYAASKQLEESGYAAVIYDAENGLPTSDANCVLSASDGYIWIGGYSGIFKYDGDKFTRLDSSKGLTSGRSLFEDSKHRIWVGTNDNGIVLIDGEETKHFTYKDGLPGSQVRGFAETDEGTIYVATTNGLAYIDMNLAVHPFYDETVENAYIMRILRDSDGVIYCNTRGGDVFSIKNGSLDMFVPADEMGPYKVTAILADPGKPGYLYFGTDSNKVLYGRFGSDVMDMARIPVTPIGDVCWMEYACDRVWVSSSSETGYIDEYGLFHVLNDIPINNSIEMMTPDYQGNLWYTSARQGVMKLVSSNFDDITERAGLPDEVVNSTALRDGMLYIGTDKGLRVLNGTLRSMDSNLTRYIGNSRVRCIVVDNDGTIWSCIYNDGKGLVGYTADNEIISITEKEGLLNNAARCVTVAKDGSLLVGTNGGLSVVKDGKVVRNVGSDNGLLNTVLLSVEEGPDGSVYMGTDGDGIYILKGNELERLGRDDGLTSDVVMRIKYDEERDLFWIITSNSIQYLKDGSIINIDSFPYNNNYDIFADASSNMWVTSSYGLYCVNAESMINNEVHEYSLYNTINGLTGVPTGNSFSELLDDGTLYMSARNGVCRVNINNFYQQTSDIIIGVRSVTVDGENIVPDSDGSYVIPSGDGRVQITASILNYSMSNPMVRVYLDGLGDAGIFTSQDNLTPLEFTGLKYGNYRLHVQITDSAGSTVYQDMSCSIVKKPRFYEMTAVRLLGLMLAALIIGFSVWRITTGNLMREQYDQIRAAKEEAERANSAKSRFLANMSHEIRTPINTIMGMDEMILREDAKDVPKGYFLSVVNYAMDIHEASESLLGLINDLLDMSKIESGKMHLVEQEYETKAFLRSIITMIRVRSDQKDLRFNINIDPRLPRRLCGDDGKIKQIVLNLLTNAVKYTEVGGFTLNVLVTDSDDEKCSLRISVKDTGIGVKPEDLDKLFTAYERLDEEKNSSIQGTGLGLDISRRFAELMGGKLWCESIYGKGSEFILTLEQKIADKDVLGEFNGEEEENVKGPYVPQFVAPDADVLVVDDNPMNLTVIKGLLKATRVFVTTAMSGEECLDKLKYGDFNVVFLDHMMPGMDGLETVKRIRETNPDLPVYALTANIASGGEEFYKSKGFNGYLTKPIDSTALEKTILKHLPDEMVMKPSEEAAIEEPEEIPEEMKWICNVPEISVEDGIKNSGGISTYIFSLNLFYDTIDETAEVIEDAYNQNDIRLYTIKVHALKSSARIVGALGLAEYAESLENAGNKNDLGFIRKNNKKFMDEYKSFKDKLIKLRDDQVIGAKAPDIPEDELNGAYEALAELIPQEDYDSVEMILEQLKEYTLPDADLKKVKELEFMLRRFDWDGMKETISK